MTSQRSPVARDRSAILIGILGVAAAFALPVAPVFAQATYSYGGSIPFDTVMGAYAPSARVSGTFTLPARLAPNLPAGTNISLQVVSYEFNDGVQTLTRANSYPVQFTVATDSFCNVTEWAITAWQGDNPVAGIDTTFSAGPMGISTENGFQGVPCGTTSAGRCVAMTIVPNTGTDFGTRFVSPATAGTWSGPTCPETPPPPPAEYSYGGSIPFDTVMGAYSMSDEVTANFALPTRLAPNLPAGTDISAQVQSYSLNDGVQTLNEANSYIVSFKVGTDSFCNVTEWNITAWQGDNPVAGVDTTFSAGPMGISTENGFQGVPCGTIAGGQCVAMTIFPDTGTDFGTRFTLPGVAGTWSGPTCPETPPPPPGQYTYGGSLPFDTVQGAYAPSDRVIGSFMVPARLAPNLPPGTDISAQVQSYSLDDGVQTLTEMDSYIVSFRVGTNQFCNITSWNITAWQGDNPVAGVDTSFSGGPMGSSSENGFQGVPCGTIAGGQCVAMTIFPDTGTDFGTRFVSPATAGTWSGPSCTPVPVPTLNPWGLLLLLCLLGWASVRVLARRARI